MFEFEVEKTVDAYRRRAYMVPVCIATFMLDLLLPMKRLTDNRANTSSQTLRSMSDVATDRGKTRPRQELQQLVTPALLEPQVTRHVSGYMSHRNI